MGDAEDRVADAEQEADAQANEDEAIDGAVDGGDDLTADPLAGGTEQAAAADEELFAQAAAIAVEEEHGQQGEEEQDAAVQQLGPEGPAAGHHGVAVDAAEQGAGAFGVGQVLGPPGLDGVGAEGEVCQRVGGGDAVGAGVGHPAGEAASLVAELHDQGGEGADDDEGGGEGEQAGEENVVAVARQAAFGAAVEGPGGQHKDGGPDEGAQEAFEDMEAEQDQGDGEGGAGDALPSVSGGCGDRVRVGHGTEVAPARGRSHAWREQARGGQAMTDWKHDGVRVIPGDSLDTNTPQTPGMNRAAAINFARAGAQKLWAGTVHIHPDAKTGAHHHGALESVIYVLRGRARMRWGERLEFVAEAGPGDFIFVPPYVPHQEINASTSETLECVLVRSDNEAVVVNLDIEPVEKPEGVAWVDPIHKETHGH